MKKWDQEREIIKALRKVWMFSPDRKQALRRALLRTGWYRCSDCGRETEKPKVDHVEPIGAFVDWNEFVDSLFCHEVNLLIKCMECHKAKTKAESQERAARKREAKRSKK